MGHAGTLLCRNTATLDPTTREENSLNNNSNRNNNRRRGRGNRNQGGGGNNSNRIDSRARGNAPQLLDKYKKLAQDAQHNGDRVQAEYYLQFADHYFRVIADNKARQDEQRSKREPDRDKANDDATDENDGEEDRRNKSKPKAKRPSRGERQRGSDRESSDAEDSSDDDNDSDGSGADDNPFVRKRGGGARRSNARNRSDDDNNDDDRDSDGEIDATVLPPAIAAATSGDDAKSKPAKPRRRTRKPAEDDGDEALSAVG